MIRDEQTLRVVFQEDAMASIPATTDLTRAVRARMAVKLKRPRRAWPLAVGGAALLAVGGGGVAATASGTVTLDRGTSKIHIHWDRVPAVGAGKSVTMTGAFDVPVTTTISGAEKRVGFHVRSVVGVADAHLERTVYHFPITAVDGKTIPHNSGAVALDYTIDGKHLQIIEQLDPLGAGPMDVRLKQPNPPQSEALRSSVEMIGGAEYLAFRPPHENSIYAIQWKEKDAVLMRINAVVSGSGYAGVDEQVVLDVLEHLQ
ncbi:MAG: hypothetical protein M3256_01840 [Actinomycetota bacterium]|nr:hypothetical protein [Actinomycetota bacterium]